MKTFFIFNTGCIRRGLDSIRIYNYLIANGWIFTRDIRSSDLIVLTTCGAVKEKEEGSLHAIKKIIERKSSKSRFLVTGCLAKINPEEIEKLGDFEYIPTREYEKLDTLLESRIRFKDIPESNTITDNTDVLNYVLAYRFFRNKGSLINIFNKYSIHRKFLKGAIHTGQFLENTMNTFKGKPKLKIVPYYNVSIAEGCLGDCTFCAIRFATGKLSSKPKEIIVEEIKEGIKKGHQLIQLVSEDTGCWGIDKGITVIDLFKEIFTVEGDFKLIIIDFNPRWIVKYHKELFPLWQKHQNKIREIFIPIQSGSDKVLKSMHRHYSMTEVRPLLIELNNRLSEVRLRTTVMIGFPGETEEDFEKTIQAMRDINFYEVTLNKYEDRPRTISSHYENKVSQHILDQRTKQLAKMV
jgi:tRNA A37 methylthiotransferase MiaB